MTTRSSFWFIFFALLPLRFALAQGLAPELIRYPETILHNGKVVTMDNKSTSTSAGTISQALAIRDGKILAHGANSKILALKGPKTEVIDLKGRTVVPGIIDTHYHAMEYTMDHWGRSVPELRKPTVKGRTWEELRKGALETAEKEAQSAKPGQWIWVRLPNRVIKDGKPIDIKVAMTDLKIFNKDELDKISRAHPIFIQAGNRGLFSSKAIEAFKNYYGALDEEITEDGVVWSANIRRSLQTDIILDGKLSVLADLYKKEQEELAAYGVTTWSSSTSALNTIRAYRLLDQKG